MSVSNDIEYIDSNAIESQWVESIALPTYSINHGNIKTSVGKSVYNTITRNYAFIKHMMTELNLEQNRDYVIVPDRKNFKTITIKFNNSSKHLSSMVVMLWNRYEEATLESNL